MMKQEESRTHVVAVLVKQGKISSYGELKAPLKEFEP